MDNYSLFNFSFLETLGKNPFAAMWYLFINGGWIAFAYLMYYFARELWLDSRQAKYNARKDWMLLSISVPRMTEQTPRAVENIFAHLAGAHSPLSWVEKWIQGRTQDTISMEIVSIEGRVQFIIRTTRNLRDLIEASIYAQYPDAEIVEIEDYTKAMPRIFPDNVWEMFGTEMIAVKSDAYPLRTYPEFEDKVSGEFKDPLAVLLENFSRLGPGEQVWYQIVLTPIDQKAFRAKAEALVKKLTGQAVEPKPGLLVQILGFPFKLIGILLEGAGIVPPATPAKKDGNPLNSRMWTLTPGERKVIEAIENKMSKIVHDVKVRFIFLAHKEIMKKSRIVHPFIGAIKQFSTNDMLSLKPESKKVGMNATLWWFKQSRNNARKRRLMQSYSGRSNWMGTPNIKLNIEELATLWHFPISMQVKAPQLKKTESRRAEPPFNLPYV